MSVRRLVLAASLGGTLLVGVAPPSRAHDQPFSHVDLVMRPSGLEVRLGVHLYDAARALGLAAADSLADSTVLARHDERLAAIMASRLRLEADGRPVALRWRWTRYAPEGRVVGIEFDAPWSGLPGRLRVQARLFREDPEHETFVAAYQGERLLRQDVLTEDRPATELFTGGPSGTLAVLATFIPAGIHHILIGPDHILFLIGLLLLGGGIGRVLRIATAFTAAHSITLALAALNIVSPPARVIEPLIALSVVIVGVMNLLPARPGHDRRGLVAFGFGFIHGFGFAGVLREFGLPREALGWSLFAFNGGVELGQALIITTVMPLLTLLHAGAPRVSQRVVTAGAWGVLLAGAWWLVRRTLLPA